MSAGGLHYTSDDAPGYRRRRAGRGFMFLDLDGEPIHDDAVRDRIKGIAIPPAWTDVWISPDPRGHLQATGRDARGRKQYRYHPEWVALRDEVKFDHLLDFGAALPDVRRAVDRDLRRRKLSHDRVVATVVRLLEESLVRVGNEEYARENGSYGLTTLRQRHAHVDGAELVLVFPGKGGKRHETHVDDRRVVTAVRRLEELPGQHLFRYRDDQGDLTPVESTDVNEYLQAASGHEITAKEYRTWMGSVLAARSLAALPSPESDREARHGVKEVVTDVSHELGNTPTVCRKSYVHPGIIRAYEHGTLAARWKGSPAGSRRLSPDERRLLAFLRSEAGA